MKKNVCEFKLSAIQKKEPDTLIEINVNMREINIVSIFDYYDFFLSIKIMLTFKKMLSNNFGSNLLPFRVIFKN